MLPVPPGHIAATAARQYEQARTNATPSCPPTMGATATVAISLHSTQQQSSRPLRRVFLSGTPWRSCLPACHWPAGCRSRVARSL